MVPSVNTTLSALLAFGRKLGVHANNIANMNSEGFKKGRAVLKEGVGQTVTVEMGPVDSSRHTVSETSRHQPQQTEPGDVELAGEIVGAMTSQRGYEANLTVLKTEEELSGTLLDLLG